MKRKSAPSHNLRSLGFSNQRIEMMKSKRELDREKTIRRMPPTISEKKIEPTPGPDYEIPDSYSLPESQTPSKPSAHDNRRQKLAREILETEKAKMQILQDEIQSLREINQHLKSELSETLELYKQNATDLKEVKQQNQELKSKLRHVKEKFQKSEAQNEELRDAYAEMTAYAQWQEEELSENRNLVEQLEKAYLELKSDLKSFSQNRDKEYTFQKEEWEALKAENEKLREEIESPFHKRETAIAVGPASEKEEFDPPQETTPEAQSDEKSASQTEKPVPGQSEPLRKSSPQRQKTDLKASQPLSPSPEDFKDNPITCPACQAENPGEANFCGYCGEKIIVDLQGRTHQAS